MLARPKSPFLRVSLVVSAYISSDILDGAGSNGVSDNLLATDLGPFMHCDDHLVA